MKSSSSLIEGKMTTAVSAVAISVAVALGMVGCSPSPNTSSSSSADSSSASASQQETSSSSSASSEAQPSSTTQEASSSSSYGSHSHSHDSDNASTSAQEPKISADQALKAALKQANLKQSQIQLVKNYLEVDDGVMMYEIEFIGPNNMEYEVDIDANNGDVISYDSEPRDHD